VFCGDKWRVAECIFVFSLLAVVMYTGIERIRFSPLWVGGSRSNAGHCYLRPRSAIEGGLTFEEAIISEKFSARE
jgi:hypothetical protein